MSEYNKSLWQRAKTMAKRHGKGMDIKYIQGLFRKLGGSALMLKQKERVVHTFRHRNHPMTGEVKSLSVKCSDDFDKEDIEKNFKL